MMQCQLIFARRGRTAEWILEGDIKSCFDNISHDWLLAHIPMDKAILRKWLKARVHRKSHAVADGGRDPTRWDYLADARQHGVGRA